MEFASKKGNDFFLAISLSFFTFCFMFLGVRLSNWYYFAGFICLFAGIKYWVKVKKDNSDEL